MNSKGRNFYVVNKFFETGDAAQLHRLAERAVRPKRPVRHAKIEVILKWSGAPHPVGFKIRNQAIVFALQMQSFGRNLFKMNFHSRILSEFTS